MALALFVGLPPIVERFFPAYGASVAIAFLLVAGIVAHRVAADFSIGIDVSERNVSRLGATFAATAVNVVGNLVLIPRLALEGAGIASLLAGVVYAGLVMPISQRHLRVPHAWSTWGFAPRGSPGCSTARASFGRRSWTSPSAA